MYRKIIGFLEAWKENKNRKPLILQGTRQVGKMYFILKYFYEDAPDYHIIVAGSLLGVVVNRTKFSFPVEKVDMKTLYPMDMEEFMLALGEADLAEQIKE